MGLFVSGSKSVDNAVRLIVVMWKEEEQRAGPHGICSIGVFHVKREAPAFSAI